MHRGNRAHCTLHIAQLNTAMTEAELLTQVIQFAKLLGWRVAHFRAGRTLHGWRTAVQGDGAGYPDLLLVRRDRVVWAELKSQRGVLSDEQQAWIDALRAAGQEVYIWRPSSWREI